jgi:hypothetical protein
MHGISSFTLQIVIVTAVATISFVVTVIHRGPCGRVEGWCTVLQAGR